MIPFHNREAKPQNLDNDSFRLFLRERTSALQASATATRCADAQVKSEKTSGLSCIVSLFWSLDIDLSPTGNPRPASGTPVPGSGTPGPGTGNARSRTRPENNNDNDNNNNNNNNHHNHNRNRTAAIPTSQEAGVFVAAKGVSYVVLFSFFVAKSLQTSIFVWYS